MMFLRILLAVAVICVAIRYIAPGSFYTASALVILLGLVVGLLSLFRRRHP